MYLKMSVICTPVKCTTRDKVPMFYDPHKMFKRLAAYSPKIKPLALPLSSYACLNSSSRQAVSQSVENSIE